MLKEKNPLIIWIAKRILKNLNAIIIINGATGSGKTYAAIDLALRLSDVLGSTFTIQNNLDFSFVGLKKKMLLPINNKKGAIFILEEVGATGGGAASREWQSKANNFFFSFMQTGRHLNQIFIMTTPLFSFLDKGVRQMVHCQASMMGINHQAKQSYAKPFIMQVNVISGKIYPKYLRYTRDGAKKALVKVTFNLPPKEVLDVYEPLKDKYTHTKDMEIIKGDNPPKAALPNNEKYVTPQQARDYVDKGLSISEVSKLFGVSTETIRRRCKDAEKNTK